MTKHEIVDRSIGLTFDFIRYVLDKPEMLDQIPDNAEIDFIDSGTVPATAMPVPCREKPSVTLRVERTFHAA